MYKKRKEKKNMAKSYGIFRIEKRHMSDIRGLELEACRTRSDHEEHGREFVASSIDWSQTDNNIYFKKSVDWCADIQKRLNECQISKLRKDAVVALDVIYTASPDFFNDCESMEKIIKYFKCCMSFTSELYGADNIISSVLHLDEKTPHLHVLVMPIIESQDHGSVKYRLSAKDVCGNKKKYTQNQDEFYQNVSSLFGLERGEVHDNSVKKKHLTSLQHDIEEAKLTAERLKNENDIRAKVNEACKIDKNDIKILSQTNASKLLKKEATVTITESDYNKLYELSATSSQLKKMLSVMDNLAKETRKNLCINAQLIQANEREQELENKFKKLQKNLSKAQEIIDRQNDYIDNMNDYINSIQEWMNICHLWEEYDAYINHNKAIQREREYEQQINDIGFER